MIAHLDEGLVKLRDAVLCGKLKIDDAIHIDPLVASATPASVETLRRALFERHPGGQLPEILLEIDSATHFSWLLLGREPHSRSELLLVYAAILAMKTNASMVWTEPTQETDTLLAATASRCQNRNRRPETLTRLAAHAWEAGCEYVHSQEPAGRRFRYGETVLVNEGQADPNHRLA